MGHICSHPYSYQLPEQTVAGEEDMNHSGLSDKLCSVDLGVGSENAHMMSHKVKR